MFYCAAMYIRRNKDTQAAASFDLNALGLPQPAPSDPHALLPIPYTLPPSGKCRRNPETPAPLKLRPYGAIQICLLLLLLTQLCDKSQQILVAVATPLERSQI